MIKIAYDGYRGDAYMITIVKNQIMVEDYEEVLHITSQDIKLRLKDRQILINGDDLKVLALSRDEILIEGRMKGLQFHYEQ